MTDIEEDTPTWMLDEWPRWADPVYVPLGSVHVGDLVRTNVMDDTNDRDHTMMEVVAEARRGRFITAAPTSQAMAPISVMCARRLKPLVKMPAGELRPGDIYRLRDYDPDNVVTGAHFEEAGKITVNRAVRGRSTTDETFRLDSEVMVCKGGD